MNKQHVKGSWKILEDFPPADREYIVAFPGSDGSFSTIDCDIWEFRSGEWHSLPDSRIQSDMPSYYIDLPMPGA